jgi:DNA replication protein DnaC
LHGNASWGVRNGGLKGWIRAARFPQTKSLDTFDFNAQPSLNKGAVSQTGALRMD